MAGWYRLENTNSQFLNFNSSILEHQFIYKHQQNETASTCLYLILYSVVPERNLKPTPTQEESTVVSQQLRFTLLSHCFPH